jgi:hypothetical protein
MANFIPDQALIQKSDADIKASLSQNLNQEFLTKFGV